MTDIEGSTKIEYADKAMSSSSLQEYRTYPIRFYGLTVIGLLNIASSLCWLSVAPVPDYASEYFGGASLSVINWFSNVFMLTYLVAGPLSSIVYDRWNIKIGIVGGACLQVLGAWLRFFSWFVKNSSSGRLALAMVGQVICAIGQPFILNAATPYAALWFSPDGRGSATTIGGLTNAVGMAIASLVQPALVTDVDTMWQGLLFIACVNTAFAIPAFFIPPKPKTPPSYSASAGDERNIPFFTCMRMLFTNYNYLIIMLSFGVLCGLFSTLSTLMPQILTPYGYTNDEAGYVTVAFIVAGIVGAVSSGLVIDKFRVHKLILKTFVPILGFMYLALLMVVKSDNFAPIIVIAALMGFFTFSLLPVALELSVESSYPVSESFSSPFLWLASQILGLVFVVSMDALRAGDDGDPPENMRRALIMGTGLSMPIMVFSTIYNSRNKRMETEEQHQQSK
ncbi:hypothetical protein O0I10_007723 [Lichtheimia ornata]|uniref:Major facilitator superfamily (MFS) profile domain-containing protein n=1 Tax=Lichtheimia ornata TaxID=688661 RepID=A0AAD7XXN4_9FUNG|nr:uncharacterized protein O0I10_007723 [Lichtheimia ornata]KAJ8656646.1 hypothetical protein O0I10_007723 [Lichtheimia ornata]